MKFTEAIKNGIATINRNWQLILVQIGAMFVSFVAFFILVVPPLAIAFIIFGLDLTELLKELSGLGSILGSFHRPSEFLSKYFGLVVLVLASILIYLFAVLALGIFVLGGSIGVISRSIKGSAEEFSMKTFFAEGKRLFIPLVGFTTVIGLMFIVLAFVLGLFGGLIAAIVSLAREREAILALFLGIFFSSILFLVWLIMILGAFAVTLYGTAAIALDRTGPVKSVQTSCRYLYRHPQAFYLYCIVFGGCIIVSFMLFSMGYPLKSVPLIGPLFAMFFQFTMYISQSYLGLATLATIFWYYVKTSIEMGEGGIPEGAPTSEDSRPEKDISDSPAHGQEDAPPEKETREQGLSGKPPERRL